MSRLRLGIPLALLLALPLLAVARPAAAADPLVGTLRTYVQEKDFLGARILIRQIARRPLTIEDWIAVRNMLFENLQIGTDMALGWDRFRPKAVLPLGGSDVDQTLARADQALLAGQNRQALAYFQAAARLVKAMQARGPLGRPNVNFLFPYILHGMARALFSEKRFGEALEVYSWIRPEYPRYRQILFEKMWTSFKAGYIDLALGAIADQRSAYLSRFVEPETYLIQIYLYKVLCREADLLQVLDEITKYLAMLRDGRYGYEEWAKSDIETRALINLTNPGNRKVGGIVTDTEREAERQGIRGLLSKRFALHKARLLEYLVLVQAYSRLATTPGMGAALRPIQRIPGRAALFKSNLEIWPADSPEEWADEVGQHRFIGESLCTSKR
jgi:hypothetical protein